MQVRDELKVTFGKEREELYASHGHMLKLLPMIKATERQLKVLRKRRDAAYATNITAKEKDLRIKNLERQMKKVIDRFNKRYEAWIL